MKYLKTFNENALSNKEVSKDKYYSEIKSYVSGIEPNIKEEGGKERKFAVSVGANDSKYGKQVEVSLNQDNIIKSDDVNSKIKSIGFINGIKKIISDSEEGKVTFVGFKFFGKKVMGAKDGKLVTIEDVSDEFKKQLKELDDKDTLPRFSFWFSVKK
jgi:hypothetical protein